jgi:hypothetical protein
MSDEWVLRAQVFQTDLLKNWDEFYKWHKENYVLNPSRHYKKCSTKGCDTYINSLLPSYNETKMCFSCDASEKGVRNE